MCGQAYQQQQEEQASAIEDVPCHRLGKRLIHKVSPDLFRKADSFADHTTVKLGKAIVSARHLPALTIINNKEILSICLEFNAG
ncbi:hypothetical protein GCM10007941_39770 [Amphritea balenae]|nr:hypothetical protein GCM10007941_39770 [Amphritea balenae]